jgi:molybdopterin synthase catalytic subunit
MFARVSEADFSQQALFDELCQHDKASQSGAVVTFTGRVRDYNANGAIDGIELEYYPGMTEAALQRLLDEATTRFNLANAGIVHRVGRLENQAQIVWVGTCAAHRQDAFNGASYMMDMLKQSVPIWKKEWADGSPTWVAAKGTDSDAAMRWLTDDKDN